MTSSRGARNNEGEKHPDGWLFPIRRGIHTHTHIYIYKCIQTCLHTCINANKPTYIHTCIHSHLIDNSPCARARGGEGTAQKKMPSQWRTRTEEKPGVAVVRGRAGSYCGTRQWLCASWCSRHFFLPWFFYFSSWHSAQTMRSSKSTWSPPPSSAMSSMTLQMMLWGGYDE